MIRCISILLVCMLSLGLTPFVGSADVTAGDHSCAVAVGDGVTDDRPAIQCQIDFMNTTHSGGFVAFPPGNYLACGLSVPRAVMLVGAGRFVSMIACKLDQTVISFPASGVNGGDYGGFRDLGVYGYQGTTASQPVVSVAQDRPVEMEDCNIWGGSFALDTAGADGRMYGCHLGAVNPGGCIVRSRGANYYDQVKFDTIGVPQFCAFQQEFATDGRTTKLENQFTMPDFSGPFTDSIYVDDGGTKRASTILLGGTYSNKIMIVHGANTQVIGGRPSAIQSNAPITITGAIAYTSFTVTGTGTRSCAGNIGVTC